MNLDLNQSKWLSKSKVKIYNDNNFLVIEYDESSSEHGYEYIQYEHFTTFTKYSEKDRTDMSPNNVYRVDFDGKIEGNINVLLTIKTYSKAGQLSSNNITTGSSIIMKADENIISYKVAIRVSGKGRIVINNISINDFNENYLANKDKSEKYLILTNGYPSDNDLYRNAFIHRRAKLYKSSNLNLDIYYLCKDRYLISYKFDGVDIYKGNSKMLEDVIKYGNYKKILIHFVDSTMIDTINKNIPNIEKVVWIHGYEAERWDRRLFNYTGDEIDRNKFIFDKNDENKFIFLRKIYKSPEYTFVFVSNYHKEACESDANTKTKHSYVIPNVVDEKLFNFTPKDIEQRKKILLIRPFKYKHCANDLAVKAIIELAKREIFKELEFNIYGEGSLFYETLSPIKDLKNVNIHNTFLTQDEISQMHKKHGVLLCPTRKDSQGVSICEAMSSGLVPVSTNIDAIPEFVPFNCGMLSNPEDYIGLANSIEYIYNHPDIFLEMSQNASSFIKNKCGIDKTISKELEIIRR
ncbi:MAG: glycosyltransferase family 4 protein [Peptostreptococcaceae bacterium]